MTTRITKKDLKARIDFLNKLTGNPRELYTTDSKGDFLRDDRGNLHRNAGTYTLDICNGGYALTRGDSASVLHRGSARDLYNRIGAFTEGIYAGIKHGREAEQVRQASKGVTS